MAQQEINKKHPNFKHGKRGTKIYNIWRAIKKRCSNVNRKDYKYYGGRGITMQRDWWDDFIKFEAYITSLPSYEEGNIGVGKLTIDRIDVEKNYEEGNIRWANATTQARNQRKMKNNTSGYTGVSWGYKGYIARICINGKRIYLGKRSTAKEAYKLRIEYIKSNNLKGFKN